MAELFDWDIGERIDPQVLEGSLCKGCRQPFQEDDDIIDALLGGMYAWSWHQSCLEAAGGTWIEAASDEEGDDKEDDEDLLMPPFDETERRVWQKDFSPMFARPSLKGQRTRKGHIDRESALCH